MIFDSHAHYDDSSFDDDRDELIESIRQNGVIGVLNCGTSMESSRQSIKLAEKYDFFYAAVGIHPEYASIINSEVITELRNLCTYEKVKAIGEIGLDYHYEENPPREVQKNAFIKQMELAEELNLPVVIHDRDAHEDTMNIIKMFPGVKGVLHCFSGSAEMARECFKLGYYIGFTGVVTFKNAKKAVQVAREVPLDRFLLETDCPYMAPEPNRGKRNQSVYIKFIISKMAEIKGLDEGQIEEYSVRNIKRLLNFD